MKPKNYITLIVFLLVLSCSNSEDNEEENSNFYALTVGNQWQYRWYNADNEGNDGPMDLWESIMIVGTEEINDNLYYKFSRTISGNFNGNYGFLPENGEHFEYYRDSLGYLINRLGEIKFSNNETLPYVSETFSSTITENGQNIPTIVTGYGELQEEAENYSTNAGSFESLKVVVFYERGDGFVFPARNRVYYTDGIGLVKDDNVFLIAETAGYYRKLESYSIQ
ncbi:MAG: hypothetical protein AAFX55_05995 [Bacteroidota bacterium]